MAAKLNVLNRPDKNLRSMPAYRQAGGRQGTISCGPRIKNGFTFIEILITLAIIAVLFIPIMQLFSHSLYSTGQSRDLITAVNLAAWQMERTKNLNVTKERLRATGSVIYPPLDEEPLKMNNTKWRIKREVMPGSDPLEVRVHVYPVGSPSPEMTAAPEAETAPVLSGEPLVTLVTLIEDTIWEEAGQ